MDVGYCRSGGLHQAQMIVTFGAGILMGLGVEFLGWSETVFDDTMVVGPLTIVALGASFWLPGCCSGI